MKTLNFNSRLIDSYWELLKRLDSGSKLELISKLTKSIKSDFKDNNSSFDKAFGAWDDSEDVEKNNSRN